MNLSNKKILFISYDGMTDALGQSQVLPYLEGLSNKGFNITLLSCEKPEKYLINKSIIEEITQKSGIDWHPIFFTSSPPILSKYYDLYNLSKKAFSLHKVKNFDAVHCRSYISAAVGLKLKRKFGVKFIFDMRGFWVDERVDAGNWNLNNPFYKVAFGVYKKKEADYIKNADAIISLTEKGKAEIEKWASYNGTFITVIPCAADFELFKLATPDTKALARKNLGIAPDIFVISYLGSIGGWYLIDEMLDLFALIKSKRLDSKFLVLTQEDKEIIFQKGKTRQLEPDDIIVISAKRKEVPFFLAASDINLFFIKQSYSKLASSPTKLGEVLAMGLPIICNSKIGDVKEVLETMDSGIVIEDFSSQSFNKIIEGLPELMSKDGARIRENSKSYFNLSSGIQKYYSVYKKLFS